MALKLNVGISRKVGLPDYGSAGASINMEVELDGAVLGDEAVFRSEVQAVFDMATRAVLDQLTDQALAIQPVPIEDRRDPLPASDRREIEQQHDHERRTAEREARTDRNGVHHPEAEGRNWRPDGQGRGASTRRSVSGEGRGERSREPERNGASNGTNGRKRFEGTPKSGAQLYAYLKDRDLDFPDIFKLIDGFGKRHGFPKSFRDWNEAEVRDGLEEAQQLQKEWRDR